MAKKEIIIGVTGSIAIYKACEIISRLKKAGNNVTVLMTKEAKEFIAPLLFRELSCNKVYDEMFVAPEIVEPVHISLAQKADLVIVAPATANVIAKLANGICDDIVTCTVISTKAPVLIAPAMNSNMYEHKATRENIKRLKSFGYKFVGPIKGHLVCGATGIGHIADIEEILKAVKNI